MDILILVNALRSVLESENYPHNCTTLYMNIDIIVLYNQIAFIDDIYFRRIKQILFLIYIFIELSRYIVL